MTETLVTYNAQDGVAVLTLTNAPANTYSHEMMRQLDDAILRARFDADVHVLVLTGAGEKFFCAGADIKMLETSSPQFKYAFCQHANETLNRLEQTDKLVIAAINGHCVGGGLEVALAADLRVARAGAGKIGLPEVALGVLPGTGGTQRLPRVLGKSKALELMVEGANLGVEEAKALGLVNAILPSENFSAEVMKYARRFCPPGKASRSVGRIKRAVHSGMEMGFTEGLALERELQQQLFVSEDAREGIVAYNQKRTPVFKGR
ncbi:MAG: enoyl-CoA hydratase/isomerase family protein [Myxococcota bacterium]